MYTKVETMQDDPWKLFNKAISRSNQFRCHKKYMRYMLEKARNHRMHFSCQDQQYCSFYNFQLLTYMDLDHS